MSARQSSPPQSQQLALPDPDLSQPLPPLVLPVAQVVHRQKLHHHTLPALNVIQSILPSHPPRLVTPSESQHHLAPGTIPTAEIEPVVEVADLLEELEDELDVSLDLLTSSRQGTEDEPVAMVEWDDFGLKLNESDKNRAMANRTVPHVLELITNKEALDQWATAAGPGLRKALSKHGQGKWM